MCRFNLIMIKEETAEELLKSDEYQKIYDNLNGYMAYVNGCCNCGSFVGSLIDKKGMDYNEAIATRKKEKLEQLYQIRDLMNHPGYKKMKETFLLKQQELSDEMHVFFEPISEFESKRTDIIHEEYSGDDLAYQMEKLYKEVGDMISALDEQPVYRKKREIYADFNQENEIMNESTIYYLTEEEEEKSVMSGVKLSDLIDIGEEQKSELAEVIEYERESFVIDEVIERTEKDTFQNNLDEFNSYYKLFSDLLKYVQCFMFATIWSEPNELKEVKTVSLNSLKIDDLAFLEFDEMVCITR